MSDTCTFSRASSTLRLQCISSIHIYTCLCTFLLYHSTLNMGIVLASFFYTQISHHNSLLLHDWQGQGAGRGAEPIQVVPDWLIPLTSSLHVCKHPTNTDSINTLVTCCIVWVLPQVYHVPLLRLSCVHALRICPRYSYDRVSPHSPLWCSSTDRRCSFDVSSFMCSKLCHVTLLVSSTDYVC